MAIWDMFRKKGEEPEDEELEDDFDPAKVTIIDTEPEKEASPEELAKQRVAERRRTIEAYVDRMFDNRCDCYMLLDHRTTPEQLEKTENLRVQVTPLNTHNPMPVVHMALDELSAHHMARAYNCLADGKPLVKKIPFNSLCAMLNNLMQLGIFTLVIHEDDTNVVADTGHINAYVSGTLLKQDTTAYAHYVQTMRSIHRTRTIKGSYYVIASELEQAPGKFAPTFFGNQEKKGVHLPVFATEALAKRVQETMKQDETARETRILTLTPVQLVNLMGGLMHTMKDKAFPVQLVEPAGRHPMTSTYFMQTLVLAYGMKRKPTPQPENAEEAEAPKPEEGTQESPIHLYTPEEAAEPAEAPDVTTEAVETVEEVPETQEVPAPSEEE